MIRIPLLSTLLSIGAAFAQPQQPPVIILFGAPGSGKGTFAELLKREYGYAHWALGDVLRGHIQRKTDIGKQLLPVLKRAQEEHVAPDALLYLVHDIIFTLIATFIDECQASDKPFMLDNVIRTEQDLNDLTELLQKKQITNVLIIYLTAPESTLTERIQNRIICPHCNALYNRLLTPVTEGMLCTFCHMPLAIRQFDDTRTVAMRLELYKKTVIPLLEQVKNRYTVVELDSSGTPAECIRVYRRTMEEIGHAPHKTDTKNRARDVETQR